MSSHHECAGVQPMRRGPVLAAASIVAILTAVCLPFLLTAAKISRNDDWLHLAARHAVIRQSLLEHGQFPLRSHFFQGGYPTLSDPEDPTLNPLTLLSVAFGEAMGLKLTAFAMHLVAGLSMYYLARSVFGYAQRGAVFSALVFSLSTWLPARHHSGNVDEMYCAVLPLVVALLARSAFRPRAFVGLALVLGLIVVDGKFVLPALFLFTLLWALLHALGVQDARLTLHWQPVARWARLLALTALFGMANILAALDWPSPRMELTYHGSIYSPDVVSAYKPLELLTALTRPFMSEYAAQDGGTSTGRLAPSFACVGWVPLALFVISAVIFFKQVVRWLVLLAVFAALAMAYNAPGDAFRLLAFLPPFDQMHAPNKYFDPFLVFIIALVGGRLFSLFSRRPPQRTGGEQKAEGEKQKAVRPSLLPSAFCLLPSGAVFALMVLLMLAAALPLAIADLCIHTHLFTLDAPSVGAAEEFHHVRGVGMPPNTFRTPHSNAYLNVRRNVGTLDSPMPVFMPGQAVPKFLVHPDDRVKPYSRYQGEAYFLEPENRAELRVMTANRIEVEAHVTKPGRLVVNQNWHKGWRVSEGIVMAHAGLLAASLSKPGVYRVSFRYVPMSFYAGLAVTLGALALAVGFASQWKETGFLEETRFLNVADLRRPQNVARVGVAVLVVALLVSGLWAGWMRPQMEAERAFQRLRSLDMPGRLDVGPAVARVLAENPFARAELGRQRLVQRDYTAALQELKEAVRLDPENPLFRRMLGEAFAGLRQFPAAIAETEAAAQIDPYDPELFVRLSAYYTAAGQADASDRMLRCAEELTESPAECRVRLAKAHEVIGANDRATAAYEWLLTDNAPLEAEFHHLMGGAYRRQSRLDDAAKAYERAIASDPNCAPAYSDLGNVFLSREDVDRALQYFREAVLRDPKLIPARFNLAQAYTLKGLHAEAQAELRKIQELTSPRGRRP